MSAPRLAYHCGTCDHELTLVCEQCLQRDHDERCDEHHQRQSIEEQAQEAWRKEAPGIVELEQSLNIDITLGCSDDEDGCVHCEARTQLMGQSVGGEGRDFTEALADLRRELIVEMRAAADHLESEVES